MKQIIILLLMSTFCLGNITAQNKEKKKKAAPPVKIEKTDKNVLFETMLSGTEKVMFIDSMVVNKHDFFNHIPMSKEAGTLSEENGFFTYTNELANHKIFAQADSIYGSQLYSTDLLGGVWSKPKLLSELNKDIDHCNYPFLLSDGLTLFFAAKGKQSMGGYDIFMTNFNEDEGTFYKPKNYGFPFNSTANDYLIAIDDLYNLGWLVSDRFQPKDKVCIYTFVPTEERQNFETSPVSEGKLKAYAKLTSIKDTWIFGDRKAAMQRLNKLMKRRFQTDRQSLLFFPINDNVVYTKKDDFKSKKAQLLFTQLLEKQEKVEKDENSLKQLREQYTKADKQQMQSAILQAELHIMQQHIKLKTLEKEIRNEENKLLTK